MQTQINVRRKKNLWSKLYRCLGLLLFSLVLTACSQGSDPQQGVISDDTLSAPFPKAITALLVDDARLIVDVVVNGDVDNPLRVDNLVVDTTVGTFSGNVPGFSSGTYTLSLVYSIIDPTQGTVEVIRTSEITVTVVANEDTPADFSAAEVTYTDTDGDSISNLDELDAGTDINTPNYAVGGQVEGLAGSGLVLQNDGSDNLTINTNGAFSFDPAMSDGSEYAISVRTQPSSPNQVCTVNNGSGTVSSAAVSNVTVICSTTVYTVGGTVSGYTGSGLVLQNNVGDDLLVSANGDFSFNSAVADGSEYVVSVRTHPGSPSQICTVNNGSGTVSGAVVSSVTVICSTNSYMVGGTVSGYAGSGLVLQNNNSDDLPVSANGAFSFSNAVADGSNYTVTVLTQPNNPNQVCAVSNGSNTVSGVAVSDITVTCSTTVYRVGGTVSGYTGNGLVLQNNNSDDLPVSANGAFSFSDVVADGSEYAVTVFTQPGNPNQVCTVSNGSSTVSGAVVSNIAVICLTTSYTVGGTVSGYTGSGLVLQNNGSDDLAITTEGDFTFSSAVTDGSEYAISVRTQPGSPNQICTVNNGSNTISGAAVSDVTVTCSTTSYTVGGTVSGYAGNGLVLRLNDDKDFPISGDGSFTFSSAVADYTLIVLTQPNNPNQICTVSNGSGTLGGVAVSNIAVTCLTTVYTVGGTVSGYTGSGLVLQNNGSDEQVINVEGSFTFSSAVADGSEYAVSVLTQPDSEVCTVSNGSGTVNGEAVSSVSVICNTTNNTAPTATSVTITDVNGGNPVVGNLLKGSYTYSDAESDPEGESTFLWRVDSVAIVGATTTSYVPVASDAGKMITFEVTPVATAGITEGAPASSGGLVIAENSAPFFTSGQAISVAEDIVVTGYTATALDVDGDTVTFSLSGGTDQEALSIDSNSGVLNFVIATRFESPADSDGNNTYVVEITATDGIHLIVRSVTVTVTKAILEVSVSSSNIKTVRFEWSDYVDATSYKLFVNSDSDSGFSLLQDNLSDTSTTITLPLHLTDWVNARYILEAYDALGNKLTGSAPVSIRAVMLSSIGYFKASSTGTSDRFGNAVSLSADGNTLAVEARWEDSSATGVCPGSNCSGGIDNMARDSGAVYVFSLNGGVWEQQAYVKASNTGEGDQFGSAVSLSEDGNTLVVGAQGEDSAATDVSIDASGEGDNTAGSSGAVYVFSRSGGVWSQQAYVKASNTGRNDFFGSAVSLSGDGNTLAVGASREDSIATGVSTDGSGEDDNMASSAGAVYVFSRSDGTWSQQAYVKASNTEADELFGGAVSLSDDGNTLAVGASREDSIATGVSTDDSGEDDNTASNAGAVYVFSRSNSVWSQQVYVKASNTGTNDFFGSAVSLSDDGNTLAVGALGEDSIARGVSTDGSGENSNQTIFAGAVYVFSRSDDVWNQQAYVKASNTGRRGDSFGAAVSLSVDGNMLAVGAPGEDGGITSISPGDNNSAGDAGAVYLY